MEMSEPAVDWFLINQLVAPEHQYLDADDPPLDSLRMAWPFKTDEERKKIQKWMIKQTKVRKIKFSDFEEAPF
jgi:hypothetical protein